MSETVNSPQFFNERAAIVEQARSGSESAFRFALLYDTPEQFQNAIDELNNPISTAYYLRDIEAFRELRSAQLTLDFICDELYPKPLTEYRVKLNALHLGFVRGMLDLHKDDNPEMYQAILSVLDPQIEKMFYPKPQINNKHEL